MFYYAHHLGGDKNKRDKYKDHKYFKDAVYFCENYDQNSFDPNYKHLPLEFFKPYVEKFFLENHIPLFNIDKITIKIFICKTKNFQIRIDYEKFN